MKTQFALLLMTEGRPVMTHNELAKLRGKSPRTVMNEIHAKATPVPMWKDGSSWVCNVADVASWLDDQREQAILAGPSHLAAFFEH